jgi:hypothetical protein
MKNLILTAFILIIVSGLYGQNKESLESNLDWEWAPIGAVWMYSTVVMDYTPPFSDYNYYWYVRSEKDTAINGQECRKLTVERFYTDGRDSEFLSPRFTYQDGGKVYMYNYFIEEFQMIYDFDIQSGDTVRLFEPQQGPDYFTDYVVDSVVLREPGIWPDLFPEFEITTQVFSYHMNRIAWYGNSFFGVPSIGEYFSYSGATYNEMTPVLELIPELDPMFNCFYDGINGVNRLRYDVLDSCECYYNRYLDIGKETIDTKVNLYPNPVANVIHVNGINNLDGNLSIYTIEGVCVFKTKIENENVQINFSENKIGMYILVIETNDYIIRKQFVKI